MKDVETKIIALIHGEISGNEAIELLKLIESDKTIKAQYEAQLQINQLAHEAACPEDEPWQMEKSRCKSLLETLSGESETSPEKVEEQTPVALKSPQSYKIEWKAVSGIAACVAGTVLVTGIMFEDEMKFEQYARMDKSAESMAAYPSEEVKRGVDVTGGVKFDLDVAATRNGKDGEKYARANEFKSSNTEAYEEELIKPKVTTHVKKQGSLPSSPSSRSAPLIASNVIPVPDIAFESMSPDFGSGFGDGEGDGFGTANEALVTSGLRAGDSTVSRNGLEKLLNEKKKVARSKGKGRDFIYPTEYDPPEISERFVSLSVKSSSLLTDNVSGGFKNDLTKLVEGGSLLADPDMDGFAISDKLAESSGEKSKYGYWISDHNQKATFNYFPDQVEGKKESLRGYSSMSYQGLLAQAKKEQQKNTAGPQLMNGGVGYGSLPHADLSNIHSVIDGVTSTNRRLTVNSSAASDRYDGELDSSTLADITKSENLRRQEAAKSGDAQLAAASKARKAGEYKKSVALLENGLNTLPQGAILNGRRSKMKKEYADASIALSKNLVREGDVAGAKEVLAKVLKIDPMSKLAEEELDKLYDPIRNNSAVSKEYTAKVDKVKQALYKGEGFYNLGLYDEAHAEFDKVLRADPYNQASRRWQTRIHNERRDYYRSAYDETRARLLTEVDRAWEIVPAPKVSKERAVSSDLGVASGGSVKAGKEKLVQLEAPRKKRLVDDLKKLLKESNKKQVIAKPAQTHGIKNLNDEVSAKVEPTSTFSLHVSDVSFKLAKSSMLDKGSMPDRNKIRPEEFVNAFDYGDPSVKDGAKVACHMEQVVHPFMQQRNLMRVSMSTAALGRSTPLRLTILLDNSGSMEREDREASVLKAMEVLVSQLQPHDEVSLISFSQNPRIIAEGLKGKQLKKLVQLVKQAPSEGGTNMEQALKLAGDVAKRTQKKGMQSRIVLMTDGAANLGNAEPEDLSKMVVALRQKGIAFDACGVGADKLDDTVLEALARKGDGRYYLLDKPEDADGGFAKQLAGALRPAASNVKVQVVFNPSRVMNYKLLGFEKHLLNKEDFRNDKVDAAEMAAQEAGSAMYQFQPFAGGKGDVGKVFVRFRDMNTGQMVERSWTIPYVSQPQTIENAKPSIQLATTAAMLAEKIRNTDVGLVDFSEYGKVLGDLNQAYSNDQRVKDLIRMVEKIRR